MPPPGPAHNIARYGFGILALAAVGFGLWAPGLGAVALAASAFLCVITLTDTLRSRIPNRITFPLLAGALFFHLYQSGLDGLLFALLGALAGFALLLPPYMLLGMGGGDLKALAALGALLGPAAILQVFLFTGLIGGILALCYLALAGRLLEKLRLAFAALKAALYCRCLPAAPGLVDGPEKRIRFPYAPAITLGYAAFARWGGIV